MLEPREADIPALFLFLVVLPLVIYILLGKWNDAVKKHARVSLLARLAAEEALRVEAMAAGVAISSSPAAASVGLHPCATCGGAATTRCARCKSVRYCSGKCQIIHWRQGHKQECQQHERERMSNNSLERGSPPSPAPSAEGDASNVVVSDTKDKALRRVKFGKVVEVVPPHNMPRYQSINMDESSEGTSVNGKVESDCSSEKTMTTTATMMKFKKPPYTLEPSKCSAQKTAAKGLRENSYAGSDAHPRDRGALMVDDMKQFAVKRSTKLVRRSASGNVGDSLKRIKMLFPYEELVKFFQCEDCDISPRGLLNCGNSCYANAVMQCLTSTKPLLIYLLRRMHSRSCTAKDWCLMCELEQHVCMLRESGGPLSPSRLLSNLRNIGCRIGGGTQEDAHEFLSLVVASMQSICLEGLGGEKEVDPGLQETTLIQQIFGGRIRSKVKCLGCHLESERYENIMDLTLEIHGWVESLEDALTQFTAPEDLDGENMYRCGRCSTYVKARKQLSVHEVPNVLTIVLKRFQTGKYGKINKNVSFPELLDMIPFMTGRGDSPPLYILYAVIVHLDTCNASFSGHYVSYVKDLHGSWFKIDDSHVQAVPFSQVMSEGAYMLFYMRSFPRPPSCYTAAPPRSDGGRGDWSPADFSDATSSSDWSLFTSSDESSFTTESVSDSFSIIDHTEPIDPIASIFGPSYGGTDSNGGTRLTQAKMVFRGQAQTRFFQEMRGYVLATTASEAGNCGISARSGGSSGNAKRHRLMGSG